MDTRRPPLISVVLPAYNESEGLPIVVSSIFHALANTGLAHEILVIDDGSTDGTREVMLDLCAKQPSLRYVRFSRNFGKEAALSAGLRTAEGDAVILMDSDGQHPPALISLFLDKWREGAEVVAGVQNERLESWLKRCFKAGYYWLMQAGSNVVIPPDAGDFRLIDRKVVDAINALPERNRQMKGLFAWVGFRTVFVPFQPEQRVAGVTKFTWRQLIKLAFTGLTSFSVVPLRLVSLTGLLISSIAFLYGCYLLFEHYVQGSRVPGWPTLAVGMMFLSGVQLLALGVIAEYLGRTFEEAKQRPIYIVAEDNRAKSPPHAPSPVHDGTPCVAEARASAKDGLS
ncbi:glycosyltransferase family 2 protein [Rhodomicrobium sp. Az07]|nr:glycosyltransferase family 2 protein [Rhodomicrobium sp. Az07]